MKKTFKLAASALAMSIAAATHADAGVSPFQPDPELEAALVGAKLSSWFTLELRYRVINNSETDIEGPTRLVVEADVPVRNADGLTEDGEAFINTCKNRGKSKKSRKHKKDPTCDLPAGKASKVVKVELPLWRFFFNPALEVTAEFQPYTLQVLHNADMDGNGSAALANVEAFSGLLGQFQGEFANTVTLSSGDNYIPGPRYNAAGEDAFADLLGIPGVGRLDMALMNAMGYEASAAGNHEFDGGPAEFVSIFAPEASDAGEWVGAQFPYLSANLDFLADADTAPYVVADGQPAADIPGSLAKTAIIEVGGETIGLVGAVTPNLASITSLGDIAVLPELTDTVSLAGELQPAIDSLTAQGVDKIIMLAHMQQITVEYELATLLNDVDVIIAGGSNTRLFDETDRVRPGDNNQGVYPGVFESPKGEPVLVVNTDGDYKYLGRLVSQFTLAGTINLDSLDTAINGAYATDPDSYAAFGAPEANPAVVELATTGRDIVDTFREPVGLTDVFLSAQRSPGVRTEETILGNLTADANLAIAQQYDPTVSISLKNGGGIRANIGSVIVPPGGTEPAELPPPDGIITRLDIQNTLAFNNGLTLLDVTAAELVALLENGVSAIPGVSGRFPQVAGVEFSYNPNLPAGSRIVDLTVTGGAAPVTVVSGGALVSSDTFRLVTLDFLAGNPGTNVGPDASGRDGYIFPCTPSADDAVCTNFTYLEDQPEPVVGAFAFADAGSEQDALAEYLDATFPADGSLGAFSQTETAPADDTRITQLEAPAGE